MQVLSIWSQLIIMERHCNYIELITDLSIAPPSLSLSLRLSMPPSLIYSPSPSVPISISLSLSLSWIQSVLFTVSFYILSFCGQAIIRQRKALYMAYGTFFYKYLFVWLVTWSVSLSGKWLRTATSPECKGIFYCRVIWHEAASQLAYQPASQTAYSTDSRCLAPCT